MLIHEALNKCGKGQYVKNIMSGWSEKFTQYGRDERGDLFWTTGNKVGGKLVGAHLTQAMRDDRAVYAIYSRFGDDNSIVR